MIARNRFRRVPERIGVAAHAFRVTRKNEKPRLPHATPIRAKVVKRDYPVTCLADAKVIATGNNGSRHHPWLQNSRICVGFAEHWRTGRMGG
jgi:hypothetical protein